VPGRLTHLASRLSQRAFGSDSRLEFRQSQARHACDFARCDCCSPFLVAFGVAVGLSRWARLLAAALLRFALRLVRMLGVGASCDSMAASVAEQQLAAAVVGV
jgi:hypothetical protein